MENSARNLFFQRLQERHLASLTRQEFTRAVRALSARYVERRGQLDQRSPLDSAGKRAAFALFYAPLHLLTVDMVVRELGVTAVPLTRIVDLGCGTGVCSAAWAAALPAPTPSIEGCDLHPWALDEARWNWRTMGLSGRATRADFVTAAERLVQRPGWLAGTGIICGWSINELDTAARERLLRALHTAVARDAALLVLEPIARSISPWWPQWVETFPAERSRSIDYKSKTALPRWLEDFADSAGLSPTLTARVLAVNPGSHDSRVTLEPSDG